VSFYCLNRFFFWTGISFAFAFIRGFCGFLLGGLFLLFWFVVFCLSFLMLVLLLGGLFVWFFFF